MPSRACPFLSRLLVYVLAVSYFEYADEDFFGYYLIDDSVVSGTDPVNAVFEFFALWRAGVGFETFYLAAYLPLDLLRQ